MATPVEVFTLLDFLKGQLDEADFEQFVQRVESTDAQLRALDDDAILQTNLPCPALIDGRCSGYAGRPLNCRSYHSLSREACEESFEHPEDLDRGHPQLRGVAAVHEGAQAGFQQVLRTEGQEARQYELVSALAEALADDQARARFERGEPAFLRPLTIPGS
jgi:Fe-S-cluster containining protein